MTATTRSCSRLLCLAIAIAPITAWAQQQSSARVEFERGYFLQSHDANLAEAAKAYERVIADQTAPASLRSEATARLAACREDLASADLARLMPPDSLAYFEIAQPGEHVARLVKMLGLVRQPGAAAPQSKAIPLDEGLFFPDDFTISPALVAQLAKFKGVAASITSVDQRGIPDGLLALHPGNDDLLRGFLETAIQVFEPAEPIDGYKTYRDPSKGWITVTSRLFLVARSREALTAAVARLRNPSADSLASRGDFQSWRAEREKSLAFVRIDGQQLVKQFGPMLRGRDAAMARAALDLDHFESLVALVGATDGGVEVRTQINFKPGQHNLAVGLVRTAPLTRRSLAAVPQGVAAVAMIGLNPPSDGAAAANRASADGSASAMDFGREIFSNIEEFSLFALPSAAPANNRRPSIPEIGLVLAVKDAAKSEALWNQLLALPVLFGAPGAQPVGEITIEGHTGRRYQFPGAPPLAVVKTSSSTVVAGTEAAVTAALKALAAKQTIDTDPAFTQLLTRLTPSSSKAVLIDVGRVVQMMVPKSERADKDAVIAAALAKDLKVSVVTDETPTQFGCTFQATGLPNVPALIKMAAAREGSQPVSVNQK